ncbi:hypothetical protein B0A49_12509 [Cryomyces minteri]|uniref:Mitochondrial pyruvate carrier n=1 Tax=Cryomyces minteri TaxID=331657 RepID=A0A4U0W6N6_9PEZI|nr:hypothetical protein B0A49_12509 [Cryomyces minteri]
MAGLTASRRRQRDEDEDEGIEDNDQDRATTPPSRRMNGSKRARLNDDASEKSPSSAVLPESYRSSPHPASRRLNANDTLSSLPATEKHQPGSIVRVKLTNFVTYTAAEFHPGPSLNMIIGPNGTGKSTLVCAICLGLGWGPQHLGRASDIVEFVKHGSREAEIEIELAAGPQTKDRNPIIRRRIKKEGSKSNWSIDGRSSTLKDVQRLCKSFSIQIDNLKWGLVLAGVSDFARPAESLSLSQNLALMGTGLIWTRWCFVIKPRNIFLASVNFLLFCVGATQTSRIFLYHQSLKDSTLGEEAKKAAKEEGHIIEGMVKDPQGALKRAEKA